MNILNIIMLLIVFYLIIKIIDELFTMIQSNRDKKTEINTNIQNTFKEYESKIDEMQNKYNKLHSELLSYKNEAENSFSEIEEYTDRIIMLSNKIIAFDDAFEEKLYAWNELLNNPNNCEAVKKQIKEHLEFDNQLMKEIKSEQVQQHICKNDIMLL